MRDYLYNLATDRYKGPVAALLKFFLFLLSLIYGGIIRVLIFFYQLRPCRLNCKVISVGNITLGGTGKTALVEYIARYLMSQNHKVAILSRGYKRKIPNPNTTSCLQADRQAGSQIPNYETMGDEPYMLAKKLDIPVIADPDRIRAAHQAIRDYKVDTVILDDGFQQWRIKKDLEIATLDATEPFGNRHLLPRGILREPLSGLKRADVIVFTKTNLNPDIQDIKAFLSENNWQAETFDSVHSPMSFYKLENPQALLNPDSLRGKTVTLFSGIGDPDSFENLIISLGINVGLALRFPDHHSYSPDDLEKIFKSSQEKDIPTIITTEKDAVRISSAWRMAHGAELLVLRIALKITKDEERFRNRLLRLYSR